ncbi:ABC transporter permease [Dactylosporangium sucinum]|uniref:Peptide ABC transporter permease n=1 Tax=Dactylosporangium sucinum TaxID=1424081 RepID=A0A917U6D4_9ACTN|nr:ABC transporter permease [Dactylosporangium sucinum]GGM61908.1 peptide ABC transporter permease [Dactylosporangium sucinum]
MRYVVRRLLAAIPVLIGVTLVSYLALSFAPGDKLSAVVSQEALLQMTEPQKAALRHSLGLDQSLWKGYLHFLQRLVHGDLGFSLSSGRPIASELTERIGVTLQLVGPSLVIGLVVGIPLGVVAAVRADGLIDRIITSASTLLIVVPGFVLCLLLIDLFAVQLRWLPASGLSSLGAESLNDRIRHLILPSAVLGAALAATLMRYTRSSVIEVLASPYIITARAKGIRTRRLYGVHALRNALVPVITVFGLSLPILLAGAIITETVFGIPGMGSYAVDAATRRDPGAMMGVILVIGGGVVGANLLTDLIYSVVDPRIRLGGAGT